MKAVIVAPGEGRLIAGSSNGAGITLKVSKTETGDLYSIWEGRMDPGTVGAGPHYHRERDEFFYVLEGEVVLRIGEECHVAGAGTFAFVPRETIHGFHNASSERATILVVHHPAGFERYIEEALHLAARNGTSVERAALAARFDMIPVPAAPET